MLQLPQASPREGPRRSVPAAPAGTHDLLLSDDFGEMDRGKIGPPSPPANPSQPPPHAPAPHPPPLLLLRTHHTHTPTPGVPFFDADYFNNYAPVMIVFLCGCTTSTWARGSSRASRAASPVSHRLLSHLTRTFRTLASTTAARSARSPPRRSTAHNSSSPHAPHPPPSARTSHHGQPAPSLAQPSAAANSMARFCRDANPRSHSARRSRSCPQILVHERKALEDGAPLGKNLNLLSGATSDGEEAAKSKRPARRWNPPQRRQPVNSKSWRYLLDCRF